MNNPMDLTGRTIMVTGASSGIGRDACILLSELGANLVLVARNVERLEETRTLLAPGIHHVAPFDVCQHAATPGWFAETVTRSGPIHGLVHCAGKSTTTALRYVELEEIAGMIDLNLTSAITMTKAFRQRQIRGQPWASVVFLSSVSAFFGVPGLSCYSAAKCGLVALARTLAQELAAERIRVNCITAGWVDSEMTARAWDYLIPEQIEALRARHTLGFGKPRDVSHAIAFLLSDAARWITGTSLAVDGGVLSH